MYHDLKELANWCCVVSKSLKKICQGKGSEGMRLLGATPDAQLGEYGVLVLK
jgi:hypothetical protein